MSSDKILVPRAKLQAWKMELVAIETELTTVKAELGKREIANVNKPVS